MLLISRDFHLISYHSFFPNAILDCYDAEKFGNSENPHKNRPFARINPEDFVTFSETFGIILIILAKTNIVMIFYL